MFHTKRNADGDLERHKSKVFVVVSPENDTITITMECETCGRVELPPIPLTHLNTLEKVCHDIAERIGLTAALKESTIEEVGGLINNESLKEARANFNATSVDELTLHPNAESTLPSTDSAWES